MNDFFFVRCVDFDLMCDYKIISVRDALFTNFYLCSSEIAAYSLEHFCLRALVMSCECVSTLFDHSIVSFFSISRLTPLDFIERQFSLQFSFQNARAFRLNVKVEQVENIVIDERKFSTDNCSDRVRLGQNSVFFFLFCSSFFQSHLSFV